MALAHCQGASRYTQSPECSKGDNYRCSHWRHLFRASSIDRHVHAQLLNSLFRASKIIDNKGSLCKYVNRVYHMTEAKTNRKENLKATENRRIFKTNNPVNSILEVRGGILHSGNKDDSYKNDCEKSQEVLLEIKL